MGHGPRDGGQLDPLAGSVAGLERRPLDGPGFPLQLAPPARVEDSFEEQHACQDAWALHLKTKSMGDIYN